jgi:hypothetical protein
MPHYIRACCEGRIIVPKVNFAGYKVYVPGNPLLRVALGLLLIIGGFLGFLPIVGFWMIPLGLLVLSVDFPPVRRFRRNATVKIGYWLHKRWPGLAKTIGFGAPRNGKM